MLIKAAINGGRSRAEHEAVPVTPDEQAADIIECLKAGASVIHLHVRSALGDESLHAADVAQTILAVRSVSPQAQIGVSTGAWILPDVAARFATVKAWEVLPDFASVNFIEEGAVELANILLTRDVDVEGGLSDAEAADVFVQSGLATRCIRALIEPQEQVLERALETVGAIEKILKAAKVDIPLVLHGTEATAWPMMDEAIARGYGVRIGLEDTLFLPDGSHARNNTELVVEAVRRLRAASSGA